MELNGAVTSELTGIPPPLPIKGNTGDYGILPDNQESGVPTTSLPHQFRVIVCLKLTHKIFLFHNYSLCIGIEYFLVSFQLVILNTLTAFGAPPTFPSKLMQNN